MGRHSTGGEAAIERINADALSDEIERKFKGVTDAGLISRIEKAEPFSYDDEQFELNRRLGAAGLTWRWAKNGSGHEIVEIAIVDEGDDA